MFSYLKYFFGISVIIVLGGAFLFGWNYRVVSEGIILEQVQSNNLTLANNFRANVWYKTNRPQMKDWFYKMKPEQRTGYREFFDFGNAIVASISDPKVVSFDVYTPQLTKLIGANQVKFTATGGNVSAQTDPNAIKGVFSLSSPSTEIIRDVQFTTSDGQSKKGTLIRSLIPIKGDKTTAAPAPGQTAQANDVDLVIEVYYDVADSLSNLQKLQYFGSGFIVLVFVILYFTLVYTSRRAEKIIEKQHDTNIELAGAKARAESENQQKSQFLANISHELRTPLNAIIGFSEIIKDEVMGELGNEQYKNYIKDIHGSGVHLLSLINDILDYSKAEAGKLDLEFEDIDLTKLISSSLRLQEPRAQSAGVNLLKDLPEEHIVIRSDSKRLKQVLLNLLSNAVKFTPAGGSVKIAAWINLQEKNSMFIEVKDTGIGIAPKDIAKALAPFGQVDSELSRRYEGTGLGLPLTKKFIELLGGQLKLTSELGQGTTVTISLPINGDPNALSVSGR